MYNIRDLLSEPIDDGVLRGELKTWQDDVYSALEAAGKIDDPAVRFSNTVPLHLLDPKLQINFQERYRKIIRFHDVLNRLSETGRNKISSFLKGEWGLDDDLNSKIMNVWENLTADKSVAAESPYGRFRNQADGSLLSRVYGALNVQLYDRPSRSEKTGIVTPGKSVRQFYGLGSIPKLEALEKSPTIDLKNKNILVFDLETAGFRPGSIREIAYKAFNTGADGVLDFGTLSKSGQDEPIALRPFQGTRGSVMHENRPVNLDEFIRDKFGMDAPVSSKGDDFIDKVMPFLRKMSEADMIVGHNIETFDYAQIFQGLAGTKRYKNDPNFKKQIDDIFEDVKSKTVDTLRMAREAPNLKGLKTSRLLGQEARPFSIENLLMNTDLGKRIGIDKLAQAMGMEVNDAGEFIFTKGLHFGDVDTLVTTGLLQHMSGLKQVSMSKSGLSAKEKPIAEAIQKQIMRSAAITPFTNIRDPSQIHQRVLDKIGPKASVNPIEHEVIYTRDLELHDSQEVLRRALAGPDPDEVMRHFGEFDRLIGRKNNMSYSQVYDHLVKPNSTEYAAYQKRLAELGFGFSGVSHEERLYGTALSDITLRGLPGMRGNIARQTMVSQFELFDPTDIKYVTGSGKITLPAQVLQEAGLLSKTDDPASYMLSIVRPTTKKSTGSVNLAYKFTSDEDVAEVSKLLDQMFQDEDRFYEVMQLQGDTGRRGAYERFVKAYEEKDLIKSLNSKGTEKYGVTVAQITDTDKVKEIIALENAANNTDDLRDTRRLQFALYHADLDVQPGGGGTLTTGGAVLQKGLDTPDKASIARSIEATRAIYDPQTGLKGMPPQARFAQSAHYYDTAAQITPGMESIYRTFDKTILPNLPKIGFGAAAAGLGALLYARKRRSDRYDLDFEHEPREPGPARYAVADVLQARMDAGYDGGRVQVDPLATANLTQHLYYGSIGHTNLGWDKNSAIYGGIL